MADIKEKLKNYLGKYLKEENLICNDLIVMESRVCANIAYEQHPRTCSVKLPDKPIDVFIKENEDLNKFQTVLFRMIEERNLNDSAVAVNIGNKNRHIKISAFLEMRLFFILDLRNARQVIKITYAVNCFRRIPCGVK